MRTTCLHRTETPQTETPWTDTPPDRDPPGHRHPGQRPPQKEHGTRYRDPLPMDHAARQEVSSDVHRVTETCPKLRLRAVTRNESHE